MQKYRIKDQKACFQPLLFLPLISFSYNFNYFYKFFLDSYDGIYCFATYLNWSSFFQVCLNQLWIKGYFSKNLNTQFFKSFIDFFGTSFVDNSSKVFNPYFRGEIFYPFSCFKGSCPGFYYHNHEIHSSSSASSKMLYPRFHI